MIASSAEGARPATELSLSTPETRSRSIRRLARPAACLLVLGMLLSVLPGASALPLAASVGVSPGTATVGSSLFISGGGWTASLPVAGVINFNGGQTLNVCQLGGLGPIAGSCTTSATGALSLVVDLWWGNAGTATLVMTQGANTATTTFTVAQSFSMTPTAGPVGTTVLVAGTGWSSGGTMNRIAWDGSGGPLTGSNCNGAAIDAQGNTTCTFTVPQSVSGTHFVTLRDNNGYQSTDQFTTVTNLALNPTTGSPGQTVNVLGTGYDNGGNIVSLTWNGAGGLPGDSCTGSGLTGTGTIFCSFNVPLAPAGTYVVQMTDDMGNTATAPFVVGPSVAVSPGSGFVGTLATLNGAGFAPLSSYNVIWSPTGPNRALVASGITDVTGSFVSTFTVPADTAGGHQVEGLDVYGNGATDTFDIVPQVLLSPATGPVGTVFSGVGTGFAGNSATTVYWDLGLGDQHTLATGTTSGTGGFSFTNGVPPAVFGTHTVTFSPAAGPSAGAAFTVQPSLTTRPFAGLAGSTVLVTYTEGMSANQGVALYWDYGLATQRTIFGFGAGITSNATGAVLPAGFGTWTVPTNAFRGIHPIAAVDAVGVVAQSIFIVGPVLVLLPPAGTVNSSATALGFNFAPTSTVTVTWNGVATPLLTALTNATGAFAGTFTVPAQPAGPHKVWANDTSSNSAIANFTVVPSLSESATRGPFLSVDTLTYQGMGAGVYVQVTWDGSPTGIQQVTNSLGTVVVAFTIPSSPAGPHVIGGYDTLGNVPNTVLFQETPEIFPATTFAYEGNSVAVLLFGFAANNAVTLSWNGLPLFGSTVGTDAQGAGLATLVVPSTPGVQQLGAYDQAVPPDVAPNVPFTVWALGVPTPVSPLTGALVNTTALTLRWSPLPNANATYTVEVSSSASFGPGTQTYASLTGTSLPLLLADGTWSWRVEALSASGATAGWSATETFLVDTKAPSASVLPLPAFETSLAFPVSWTASDPAGSGVAGVWIYWSNTSGRTWSLASSSLVSTSPYTFTAPGGGTYEFAAVGQDLAGNVGSFPGSQATTVVDPSAPSVGFSVSGPHGAGVWYTGATTVTVSALGGSSGVRAIWYAIGTGAFQVYQAPLLITANGVTTVRAFALSGTGVNGSVASINVSIDSVVPSTTSNASSAWSTHSPVILGLVAVAGPSGSSGTYWSVDGSNWQLGNVVTVSGDGVHALSFYSVSGAGLLEPVQTQTVRIDTTPPRTVAVLTGNLTPSGWYGSAVDVTLSSTDATSGVAATYYAVTSSASVAPTTWSTYTVPLVFTTGSYTVWYRSVDVAGNSEVAGSTSFQVDMADTQAPGFGALLVAPPAVWTGTVTYSITLTDPAGFEGAKLQLDQGAPMLMEPLSPPAGASSVVFTVSIDTTHVLNGQHTLTVVATNALGQTTSFGPQRVNVDNPNYGGYALMAGLAIMIVAGVVALWWNGRRSRASPAEDGGVDEEGPAEGTGSPAKTASGDRGAKAKATNEGPRTGSSGSVVEPSAATTSHGDDGSASQHTSEGPEAEGQSPSSATPSPKGLFPDGAPPAEVWQEEGQ